MIYYLVTGKDDKVFKKWLEPSIENIEHYFERKILIELGTESISKKYNKMLDSIGTLKDDDYIVFSHDDVIVKEKYLERKIEMYFNYCTDVGLAGVIGTTKIGKRGGWWFENRDMYARGHIIQHLPNKEPYHMIDREGMFSDMVSVDGCIMFMRGSVAKDYRFDENLINNYHFYDIDTCFTLLSKGVKIGIIDVLVEHKSEGPLPRMWFETEKRFYEKWKNKVEFPCTVNSFMR